MKVICSKEKPYDWDQWLVEMGNQAGFLQSTNWATISKHVCLTEAWYLEVLDERGVRIAGMLALHSEYKKTTNLLHACKNHILGLKGGMIHVGDGPVICENAHPMVWSKLLGRLDKLIAYLNVKQVQLCYFPALGKWRNLPEIRNAFHRHRYSEQTWATSLVKLQAADDELLSSFKSNARKGINKCQKANISIRECETQDEFEQNFFIPFYSVRSRSAVDDLPKHWWGIDSGKNYKFFYAVDHKDRVLGMLGTYTFNKLTVEIMSERTNISREKKISVQDMLHWHAFKVHREAGSSFFDLAGFSPNPQSAKEKGIRNFKEKWGGTSKELHGFSKSSPSYIYRYYVILKSMIGK